MSGNDQLRRLLLLLPKLETDHPIPIAELARELQVTEAMIVRDLDMLIRRDHPEPAGFMEAITVGHDGTHAWIERPSHFRRPTRLTRQEAAALELGLGIMQQESGPEDAERIARTRAKLQYLELADEDDSRPTPSIRFDNGDPRAATIRARLGECAARSTLAMIAYQRPQDAAPGWREVGPLGLACVSGTWYLIAQNGGEGDVRQFRLDRVHEVEVTATGFMVPDGFDLESFLGDGRPFVGRAESEVRIRYTGVAARVVSEDDALTLEPDGSVTVTYPLADQDWAIRQALRYGNEAEVLAPDAVRRRLVDRIALLIETR